MEAGCKGRWNHHLPLLNLHFKPKVLEQGAWRVSTCQCVMSMNQRDGDESVGVLTGSAAQNQENTQ